MVPTIIGVTLFVFMGVRFLPGDVIDQILADYGPADPEVRARLEERYDLGGPIITGYVQWMGEIGRGDFGESFISGLPVASSLKRRLPVTFQLGAMAMAFSIVIALPIGVMSAVKQDSMIDYVGRSFSIALIAIPSFWIALLVITYGFNWFGWTPPLRYERLWENPLSNLRLMWVPAVILGGNLSGSIMRLTRSTMLEVMRQDYVRTARAKGLREIQVIVKHALRNAALPVITVIGLRVGVLVGGTVILERIFSLPGMANYLLTSIQQRDYPVVQATVLLSASAVIMANLLVDISYAIIDPRIRYS